MGDDWIAELAVTMIILRLPTHILTRSRDCIWTTNTIHINLSHIGMLKSSYMTNIKIAIFFNQIISRFSRLSSPVSLSTNYVKTLAPKWPPTVCKIFCLQKNLISPTNSSKDWHLLLGRKSPKVVEGQTMYLPRYSVTLLVAKPRKTL